IGAFYDALSVCALDVRTGARAVTRDPCSCPRPVQARILRDIVGNPYRPVRVVHETAPVCPRCGGARIWLRSHNGDVGFCDNCQSIWLPRRQGRTPWLTPTVVTLAQAAYEEHLKDGTLDPD